MMNSWQMDNQESWFKTLDCNLTRLLQNKSGSRSSFPPSFGFFTWKGNCLKEGASVSVTRFFTTSTTNWCLTSSMDVVKMSQPNDSPTQTQVTKNPQKMHCKRCKCLLLRPNHGCLVDLKVKPSECLTHLFIDPFNVFRNNCQRWMSVRRTRMAIVLRKWPLFVKWMTSIPSRTWVSVTLSTTKSTWLVLNVSLVLLGSMTCWPRSHSYRWTGLLMKLRSTKHKTLQLFDKRNQKK